MGLFNRKGSRNWKHLKGKGYNETAKSRDVHSEQSMERGDRGQSSKPVRERIIALILAVVFGGIGFALVFLGLMAWGFFKHISSSAGTGASFLAFNAAELDILGDFKLYAISAGIFLLAWVIINERLMSGWRSSNSMIDSSDINTYENDQHIMLPEEIQRNYDWFPDTGAHSSVQVSSMLSHMMIDKKGLKRVAVTDRHTKDLKSEMSTTYKGDVVTDSQGNLLQSNMPIIDEEFGQDLFTASNIPVSEKEIRIPVDVRKIEYNPVDDTGSRKDRDKQPYDTVGDLINGDWEFPNYEVQRPAGAYIVDVAPVNTMVLAITRAGKGKLARFV